MDDNVDGDAVTETTDARAENGANTPMGRTNANDHALLQQLAINGKPHPVRAYVATGEEALVEWCMTFNPTRLWKL
ncbi:hypothetical protein HPB52_021960 [Rhipicephalus sanguineus]|nr:hypothetical protein HPB52_021960 [Rhipicephalus sanguineus]